MFSIKKLDIFKTVYPNKVFDYMACSRPVILAIDGAARDLVVQEAHAGVFCEPENPHDLKEKILFLAGNREKGEELGRNGYSFVTAHYTREALAETYSNALKLITNQ